MKEQMHTINRTIKTLINESKINVRNKKAMSHIHDFEGEGWSESESVSHSVVFNCLQPHGL